MTAYGCFHSMLISVATVCLLGTQALAQASAPVTPVAPSASEELPSESSQSVTAPSDDHLKSQRPASDRLSCPAGQFDSAFPDVSPDDWAYEAVNRLAIGPIRCFPITPQSSIER
jgi:hypothetical protein